jgi:hypothetical protein
MQKSKAMSCENVTKWNGYRQYLYHSRPDCQKCWVKDNAEEMEITVYEWPLLKRELEAESAVFELNVLNAIAEWRNITYTLLVDVLSLPVH